MWAPTAIVRVTCDERFAHLVGWDANYCVRLAWGDLAPRTGCIELLLIQDPPNSSASHSTNRVPVSTAICPNVKAMSTRNVERLISPQQVETRDREAKSLPFSLTNTKGFCGKRVCFVFDQPVV
jgi:hypothetical protein